MENMTLFEKSGIWHFQGKTLTIGEQVLIDGIPWKILGVGRSAREGRAPFIWIQNEYYGTTVYVPFSPEPKPRLQALPQKAIRGYYMTAA